MSGRLNVVFRRLLATRELQAEMTKAGERVLPSRAGSGPNIVKEARVIGMPIMVSPNGGHSAYVRDGGESRRVDSEDPRASPWTGWRAIWSVPRTWGRAGRRGLSRAIESRAHGGDISWPVPGEARPVADSFLTAMRYAHAGAVWTATPCELMPFCAARCWNRGCFGRPEVRRPWRPRERTAYNG